VRLRICPQAWSTASTGDSLSVTFNDCHSNADNATLNGGFSITGLTLTGDPSVLGSPWAISATLSYSGMNAVSSLETVSFNGSVNFSLSSNGVTEMGSMAGNSMTVANATESITLSNFSYGYSVDTSTLAYTLDASGTLSSSKHGGSVTFATPVSFQGVDIASSWPTSGTFKITGANNTSVTLTAMGGDSVRLEVDSTGDGIADTTIDTTWTILTSS
jgi:hypothetical protein